MKKVLLMLLITVVMVFSIGTVAFAADGEMQVGAQETQVVEEAKDNSTSSKAIAAAIVVGLAAAAGAIGMALAISKSSESMARQPEISGKINSAMMLGLVFIETAIIYALIVAILIIFVL